jgi:hypothetical protein
MTKRGWHGKRRRLEWRLERAYERLSDAEHKIEWIKAEIDGFEEEMREAGFDPREVWESREKLMSEALN